MDNTSNEPHPTIHHMPNPAGGEQVQEQWTQTTQEVLDHIDVVDELHAYCINAVLKAKGIEATFTPYEAAKVWTIASHLEEILNG